MLRRFLIPPLLIALAAPAAVAQARTRQLDSAGFADSAPSAKAVLHKAEAVRAGRGKSRGHELTPLLKALAVKMPRLHGRDRLRATRLLARPTIGDTADGESGYLVQEHSPPYCPPGGHFCIHWVDSTADAPSLTDANGNGVPDYVEAVDGVFEHVYDVENVQMGWRPPVPDGGRGGSNLTDVYIKDLGGQGIYGYSAPDPLQRGNAQAAYLVMDNNYSAAKFPRYGGNFLPPLEVTAAHEYNHVLQFGYDVAQDTWMFESSAVWMEDKVYTDVNDYLQYLTPWSHYSFVPVTQFNANQQDDPVNVKVYGDAVWNRWLDAHYGQDIVRNAWERSLQSKPASFAPGAYDLALRAHGTSFFDAFVRFAVDTAEWRDANSPFAEGSTFPDMERATDHAGTISLNRDAGGVRGKLYHTAFSLVNVAPTSAPRIKLVAGVNRGTEGGIGIVCRAGDEVTGTSTSSVVLLPKGGERTITLNDPGRCSRITAVIVNADARTTGRFSRTAQDWEWKREDQPVEAHISTDFTPPSVRVSSPRPGQHGVHRGAKIRVRFSEPLGGLDAQTVVLIGPGGHRVKARVHRSGSRVVITPLGPLRAGARYTVRLSSAIEDAGGNTLPAPMRHWAFSTGRK